RTMHTEVDVPNPDRVLLPGLYAQATVALERKPNALTVPLQAVNQGERNTVYVIGPSHAIEIRPVTLGIQTATDAEVDSGLKEGGHVGVGARASRRAGRQVLPKRTDRRGEEGEGEEK